MTPQEAKQIKEKMMSSLLESCGVFFAFSNKQFDENKTPLKEGEKYVSIDNGGYMPKSNLIAFKIGLAEIGKIKGTKKKIEYDVSDFQPDENKVKEYEERQGAKAERYSELATKAKNESEQRYQTAKEIGDFIPMGQPILVGHHSEGRHRRDLNRIDTNMRKSIEADEKAKYYEDKAKRAESSNVISSDDPAAVVKLIEKLNSLVKNQELMKAVNKIIKNKKIQEVEKVEQIQGLGLTEDQAVELLKPGRFQGQGFAGFQLTNNNAKINSVKKRIEKLRESKTAESKEIEINGVRVLDNVEDNRLQIFFDYKPEAEVRTELKRNGFRWSPRNSAWQSYRGQHQIDRAKRILS